MQEIKLMPRLACIAGMIHVGARLADVGTDHAHLPLALLQRGVIMQAIASDLREGPLSRAQENAVQYALEDKIQLRLSAGLMQVRAEECDTISIAGMGGETIVSILQDALWTAQGGHTLLLQPMTRIAELRQFLWAHGYTICQEVLCKEDRRWYVVLQVRGGASCVEKPIAQCYSSAALLQDAQAGSYLQYLLAREIQALQGMQQGTATRAQCQMQQQIIQHLQCAMEECR